MKNSANKRNRKYISSIVVGIVCLVISIGILLLPNVKKEVPSLELADYTSVSNICELATLKSYYHNVITYEKERDGGFVNDVLFFPFGAYTEVGYKQFWMEYHGIVETGIDASQIQIHEPDAKGIVEIYIPDAKILNISADDASLTDPLSETGWFTSISGTEKADAFAKAQKNMRQEAENNSSLLNRAKENAKKLLEQYIINTGKEMGQKYTVKWSDKPL